MTERAVLDASPLIAFHQIGKLDLIQALFDQSMTPPAVAGEVSPSLGQVPLWLHIEAPETIPLILLTLDSGEREAIALALQLTADVIVLDDRAARIQATRLGLNVIGSAGLLVLARRRALIERVKPELDAMISRGLYVSTGVYEEVLRSVGEEASR